MRVLFNLYGTVRYCGRLCFCPPLFKFNKSWHFLFKTQYILLTFCSTTNKAKSGGIQFRGEVKGLLSLLSLSNVSTLHQRNSHCIWLFPLFSVLQPERSRHAAPGPFSPWRCSSGLSVAVSHSVGSISNVPTAQQACHSSVDPYIFWIHPLCSPGKSRCDALLCASRSCGWICGCVQVMGRIGVHSLSQVLSTVLVFFVRYSSADLLRHVYSLFAVTQYSSLSELHSHNSSVFSLISTNPPHCRKYSPDRVTQGS